MSFTMFYHVNWLWILLCWLTFVFVIGLNSKEWRVPSPLDSPLPVEIVVYFKSIKLSLSDQHMHVLLTQLTFIQIKRNFSQPMDQQWWDQCRQSRTPFSLWSSSSTSWSPSSTSSTASAGASHPSWPRSRRRSLQSRWMIWCWRPLFAQSTFTEFPIVTVKKPRRHAKPGQWVPQRRQTGRRVRWKTLVRDRGPASPLAETLSLVKICLRSEQAGLQQRVSWSGAGHNSDREMLCLNASSIWWIRWDEPELGQLTTKRRRLNPVYLIWHLFTLPQI